MTRNLHDSVLRGQCFAQHVIDLAVAFGVYIDDSLPMTRMDDARAITMRTSDAFLERPRGILIAPVVDETTYAVALHELGHLNHPLGRVHHTEGSQTLRTTGHPGTVRDVKLLLTAEQAAWEWAHTYAMEWTEVMTFVETSCMAEYLAGARRYGVKEA